MTRDDIIRMAREVWSAGEVYIGPSTEPLERFAVLVAAAEREECAALCERFANRMMSAEECADAIRAGSEP
jgi:hypothetical protein